MHTPYLYGQLRKIELVYLEIDEIITEVSLLMSPTSKRIAPLKSRIWTKVEVLAQGTETVKLHLVRLS